MRVDGSTVIVTSGLPLGRWCSVNLGGVSAFSSSVECRHNVIVGRCVGQPRICISRRCGRTYLRIRSTARSPTFHVIAYGSAACRPRQCYLSISCRSHHPCRHSWNLYWRNRLRAHLRRISAFPCRVQCGHSIVVSRSVGQACIRISRRCWSTNLRIGPAAHRPALYVIAGRSNTCCPGQTNLRISPRGHHARPVQLESAWVRFASAFASDEFPLSPAVFSADTT